MNYLLAGCESKKKEEFLQKLRKSLVAEKSGSLDEEVFRAGESAIRDILNSLNTLYLASSKKLILVKDIERLAPKELESLIKNLKKVPSSTVLVMESSRPGNESVIRELARHAKFIKCDRLTDAEIPGWITVESGKRGKKISPAARELIKEYAGNDLSLIANEIDKVACFAGKTGEITRKQVEAVSGRISAGTVFRLTDLVLARDSEGALRFAAGLLEKEKPQGILNLLAWQFRNFAGLKSLARNCGVDKAARALGVSRGFAAVASGKIKGLTQKKLKEKLSVIVDTEFLIKSGRLDAEQGLLRALVRLSS